jgi:hypothetical protein
VVDLDRFLRSVVQVRNEGGGHDYDGGIRTFDCPFCGDAKGRGWLGVTGWGAGCWNSGCDAEPSLPGGAIEWARSVLGLRSRAETWQRLVRDFGSATVVPHAPAPRNADFCRIPPAARSFTYGSPMQIAFERFAWLQWGLHFRDLVRWGLLWCPHGRYAFRIVIPVVMGGAVVGFQARTIRRGVEPKYLTSSHGPESDPEAECGRPAAALLFNADGLREGRDALLVEGAGDVMAWERRGTGIPAVASLGVALTPAKIAMLRTARLSRAIVALDAEPAAQARAELFVDDLRAERVVAILGRWVGGKDAGSGAALWVDEGERGSLQLSEFVEKNRA